MIMIITTEFTVIVVIVAVSACSLPRPVCYCHRCLISPSWTNVEHSRRLLAMTVGARFPSSLSPPFPVAPPSSPSCLPFSYPLLPCPHSSPVCPLLLTSTASIQLGLWGERCKLPQRVRAERGRQTLLVYFQTEISALFVTCTGMCSRTTWSRPRPRPRPEVEIGE